MYPGAAEICGDGIDQDCSGADLPCTCSDDADGDGHVSYTCGGDDCCDSGGEGTDFFGGHGTVGCSPTNAAGIFPGAAEPCDGVDHTCDGWPALCSVYGGLRPRAPKALRQNAVMPRPSFPTARQGIQVPRLPMREPGVSLNNVYGAPERIWVLAVQGQDHLQSTANSGRGDIEVCEVANTDTPAAGALLKECSPTSGSGKWTTQVSDLQHPNYGHEAVLYGQNPDTTDTSVSCLFNFLGVQDQDVGGAPAPWNAACTRFPIYTNTKAAPGNTDYTKVLGDSNEKQSSSTSPSMVRAYYQMVRMNAYIFVLGGHNGTAATGSVERHEQ